VPPALTIETERLRGERVGPRHIDAFSALLGDPRVGATLGGVRDRAAVEALIERDGHLPRAWFDRATGAFVARGGLGSTLVEGEPVIELGWAVVPERWGQGLATELGAAAVGEAAELGIPELVAFTHVDNVGSRRVMEKLGMTYDRTFVLGAYGPHLLYRLAVQRPSKRER
jgi:ribosomal-protein-alanine N-acetyltransferase